MRQVPTWPEYFREEAIATASRSKDPSTQVGAIIVDKDKATVSKGYNGFPSGILETEERWQRPIKYDLVIHAECNAIARAAKRGIAVDGCTMYVTHFPCLNCAKTIIAAGIKELYYGQTVKGWDEDHKKAFALMAEAGIKIDVWAPSMPTVDLDSFQKAVERFDVIVQ